MKNQPKGLIMRLEKIYEILKENTEDDFYKLKENDFRLILKDDVSFSILKKRIENRFGEKYFFDTSGNAIELNNQYDKLIKKLCELKDFPDTYNKIYFEKIVILYNNVSIYEIGCITISHYSSLHVSLPCSIKVHDYEFNICQIFNSFDGGMTQNEANSILTQTLNITESTFEDFLSH